MQKDRLCALHPDMSDTMIDMKILRKCGGELEHAIKCRCVEPCSTEDYINAMEDIITRTTIGKTWTKIPIESKMVPTISREDRRPEEPVLKCHKFKVIEEVQCTEEKEESDLDFEISEDTPVEDYTIEIVTAFFEVTEVHTHLPQYSEDCHNLINFQHSRMCKTKPPGRISRQLLAIDFTSHRASRQRQSSHVSHENVTQSPNPFQHYAQRSCNFTSLASASPTLSMLTHPHRPPSG
ncbi:hypothetical protein O181_101328 [Austropuccinia psidii MF-1]|uniref:Uncharacterized protein n=1 Tax=Austropuccinia psidii MF-1 TaxID=1389203 RepID=A0A9Q3JGC5_9BASI|nr:hypothetical protein [Austropuccinia psidii MF-1]